MADYDKVGLLTVRNGRILLCRKKHTTSALILPGEVPRRRAIGAGFAWPRELREELGMCRCSEPEDNNWRLIRTAPRAASQDVDIELYRAGI